MFKKLLGSLNKRKVKVFLLFLLCSVLAWSISKLSDSYESRAAFELEFVNFPDTLLLNTKEKKYVNVKLRTSGFQFLRYGISPKKLRVDLRDVAKANEKYYITEENLKPQFEKQLSNTVSLLELTEEKVYVDLYQVVTKEVPIVTNITLNLAQNHLLNGTILIEPSMAKLKGPENEVSKINKIFTAAYEFNEMSNDFSKNLGLVMPDGMTNSQLLTKSVVLSGKVTRFSEKQFSVPVASINLPDGYSIRIFPNTVTLVCKASIERLKTITDTDFDVVVNCDEITPDENTLKLQIVKTPADIYSVRLLEDTIEFVLEKL